MAFDVNGIKGQYDALTNTVSETNKAAGNGGGVTVSYENGELLFEEADGDTNTIKVDENLSATDLENIAKEIGGTVKADKTEEAQAADAAKEVAATQDTAAADGDLAAKKAELEQKQADYNNIKAKADEVKVVVDKLSNDIEKEIAEALDEQKKITQKQKEDAQRIIKEQIEQFKKDKEAGKDVSVNDLGDNVAEALKAGGYDKQIQSVVQSVLITSAKAKQMSNLLDVLGNYNEQMKELDSDISELESDIAELEEEAAKKAACTPPPSCDPMGFVDEASGVKYEFVVDRDGNGELSSFSEFLGANDQWKEMEAMDKDTGDGNGIVDKEEMEKAGVKVLVTNPDGSQALKSIEEAFGTNNVSVDLSKYKQAGAGQTEATNGQELLGNFELKVGDDVKNAYQTNDTADYLKANYKFTNEEADDVTGAADKAAAAKEGTDEAAEVTGRAKEIGDNEQFYTEYKEKLAAHEENIAQLMQLLELDQETIDAINENAEAAGKISANAVVAEIEEKNKAEEKAQAEQPAEETKEEEQAGVQPTAEAEEEQDKKDEEEKK